MFLAFLLRFIVAPLAKGQDPYAILGVERLATQNQIKGAFRAKAKKLHPDINKEPGAQKKWITISDAFELLSDPKARERYDKYGLIDETLQENSKNGANKGDKIRDILARETASRSTNQQQGEFDYRQKPEVVVDIDDRNFVQLTSDGRPWVIYAFQDDWQFNHDKEVLEELFQKTGLLFGIAKLRAYSSPKTAQFLGIKTIPQIVVFDRSAGNKTSLYNGEKNVAKITRFASQRFGVEITTVSNDQEMVVWRKKNLDKLHVILFSELKSSPVSYELAAAFLKRNAVFAFAHINHVNIKEFPRALGSLSVDELPTYIIYRMGQPRDDTFGGPVIPLVAPMTLDAGSLSAIVRRYSYPVFAPLNSVNFNRLCHDRCIIYASGLEMAEDIKIGVNDMNIETGLLNITTDPGFANHFQLQSGDFLVLKPKTNEYTIWNEMTTWSDFRKKLEFMQHGMIKFQKTSQIPSLNDPIGQDTEQKKQTFTEKLSDVRFQLGEVYSRIYAGIKKLPAVLVLILFALVLIIFGELFLMCFKPRKEKNSIKQDLK